jgi:hypothetical protein
MSFTWFRRPRRVVYTVLFGYSEEFNDFKYKRDDIDFICFTDDPELRSDFWRIVRVSSNLLDAPRAAKIIKLLAHRYLPQYDWSLYLDNTVRLKLRPRDIFTRFLADADSPLVCFIHPDRNCIYDEARVVIDVAYDDPTRIERQIESYRWHGYPAKNGLFAGTLLLRRHHEPAVVDVMEQWHQQVLAHSYRDQLSFPVVCWHNKFVPKLIHQNLRDNQIMRWPVSSHRVPRDFDDIRYVTLNPDVTMNPRKHFLLHGAAEKRRYK